MKINDEIKNVIEGIFSASDAGIIKEMIEIVTMDLDNNHKSKRLSQLRDIINKKIK